MRILCIVMLVSWVGAESLNCRLGDRFVKWSGDGQCYKFINQTVLFSQANSTCQSYGGYPTSVKSEEQENFLFTMMSTEAVGTIWIGLYQGSGGQYYWYEDNSLKGDYGESPSGQFCFTGISRSNAGTNWFFKNCNSQTTAKIICVMPPTCPQDSTLPECVAPPTTPHPDTTTAVQDVMTTSYQQSISASFEAALSFTSVTPTVTTSDTTPDSESTIESTSSTALNAYSSTSEEHETTRVSNSISTHQTESSASTAFMTSTSLEDVLSSTLTDKSVSTSQTLITTADDEATTTISTDIITTTDSNLLSLTSDLHSTSTDTSTEITFDSSSTPADDSTSQKDSTLSEDTSNVTLTQPTFRENGATTAAESIEHSQIVASSMEEMNQYTSTSSTVTAALPSSTTTEVKISSTRSTTSGSLLTTRRNTQAMTRSTTKPTTKSTTARLLQAASTEKQSVDALTVGVGAGSAAALIGTAAMTGLAAYILKRKKISNASLDECESFQDEENSPPQLQRNTDPHPNREQVLTPTDIEPELPGAVNTEPASRVIHVAPAATGAGLSKFANAINVVRATQAMSKPRLSLLPNY